MKQTEKDKTYFFVDESGDPIFYDKNGKNIVGLGVSKYLMIGFIETNNPKALRNGITKLHEKIKNDAYYEGVPSFEKSTKYYFHAKDDIPEIRKEVFDTLKTLEFKAHFVFARKHVSVFNGTKIQGEPDKFYSHLITMLFKNRLHLAKENYIYFEKRGNKEKQEYLENAIELASQKFKESWEHEHDNKFYVQSQTKTGEICLQIIDYVSWAVQRVFTKSEMRFFKALENKISFVWDIYDFDNYKKGNTFYTKKNKLDTKKISPL